MGKDRVRGYPAPRVRKDRVVAPAPLVQEEGGDRAGDAVVEEQLVSREHKVPQARKGRRGKPVQPARRGCKDRRGRHQIPLK